MTIEERKALKRAIRACVWVAICAFGAALIALELFSLRGAIGVAIVVWMIGTFAFSIHFGEWDNL